MKVRPLGDRILVKPLAAEEKTASGIVLPDTAKEKPQQGEILAVGSGKLMENGTKVELEVQVGDKVIYSKYAGNEIKVDGDDCIILNERDVLAIFE